MQQAKPWGFHTCLTIIKIRNQRPLGKMSLEQGGHCQMALINSIITTSTQEFEPGTQCLRPPWANYLKRSQPWPSDHHQVQ